MEDNSVRELLNELHDAVGDLQKAEVLHPAMVARLSEAVGRLNKKAHSLQAIQRHIQAIQEEILRPVANELEAGTRYSRLGFVVGLVGIVVSVLATIAGAFFTGRTASDIKELRREVYDVPTAALGGAPFVGSPLRSSALKAIACEPVDNAVLVTRQLRTEFPGESSALVLHAYALAKAALTIETQGLVLELAATLAELRTQDPTSPYLPTLDALSKGNLQPAELVATLSRVLNERQDLTPAFRAFILRFRAQGRRSMGNLDDAKTDLESAIALDPTSADNIAELSSVYRYQRRWDEAIAKGKEAVDLEPCSGRHWTMYGGALFEAGKHAEAVEPLSTACTKSNNQWQCARYLTALVLSGRKDEALEKAPTIERLRPTKHGSYYLGQFWANCGDKQKTYEYLKRANDDGLTDVLVGEEQWFGPLANDPQVNFYLELIRERAKQQSKRASRVQ